MKTVMVVIGGLLAAFVVFAVWNANTPEYAQRSRDRAAIQMCRDSVNDTLLDRDARLLARDTCRAMEDRFRKTHGRAP